MNTFKTDLVSIVTSVPAGLEDNSKDKSFGVKFPFYFAVCLHYGFCEMIGLAHIGFFFGKLRYTLKLANTAKKVNR